RSAAGERERERSRVVGEPFAQLQSAPVEQIGRGVAVVLVAHLREDRITGGEANVADSRDRHFLRRASYQTHLDAMLIRIVNGVVVEHRCVEIRAEPAVYDVQDVLVE